MESIESDIASSSLELKALLAEVKSVLGKKLTHKTSDIKSRLDDRSIELLAQVRLLLWKLENLRLENPNLAVRVKEIEVKILDQYPDAEPKPSTAQEA